MVKKSKSKQFENDVQQVGAWRKFDGPAQLSAINAYLNRFGAVFTGIRAAQVTVTEGKYRKIAATIRLSMGGEIDAPPGFEPTEEERAQIEAELRSVIWPQHIKLRGHFDLPPELKNVPKEQLAYFDDADGSFIMIQQRVDLAGARKVFHVFTYWSDGCWRRAEPDVLPLWGLDQLPRHAVAVVHEGVKAAKHCRWMAEGKTPAARKALEEHPWRELLEHAAHVAWIGGAPNPHRTDWEPLARHGIKQLYIVADNDQVGFAAVPYISRASGLPAYHVQFDQNFPQGFDLADSFPKHLFEEVGGKKIYIGPPLQSVLQPATWATDVVAGSPKLAYRIRPEFADQWAYIDNLDRFVSLYGDNTLVDRARFNAKVRAFSHAADTAGLLQKHYRGRRRAVVYEPGDRKRLTTVDDLPTVNLYRRPALTPAAGDLAIWEAFLEYLFPNVRERHQSKKWLYTLMEKPGLKMAYGIMLISPVQGLGKTTFANIAAAAVGHHNVSYPSEKDIVDSSFNAWIARRRLVVVNEIYSGHSWKAYNSLKSLVTDPYVHVNEKFQPTYELRNYAHFIIASNTDVALKLEPSDRRWFVPALAPVKWSTEKFGELHDWLRLGGVRHIMHEASTWNDFVRPGEEAPMTAAKAGVIEDSRSAAITAAIDLASAMSDRSEPTAVTMSAIRKWIELEIAPERNFEKDQAIRRAMEPAGAIKHSERVRIGGRAPEYIMLNAEAADRLSATSQDAANDLIRAWLVSPHQILPAKM